MMNGALISQSELETDIPKMIGSLVHMVVRWKFNGEKYVIFDERNFNDEKEIKNAVLDYAALGFALMRCPDVSRVGVQAMYCKIKMISKC